MFEEEKMKFRHKLKHGRKTTPCINNILQLLLRKLFHNMIGYLVCLDAVGHAVQTIWWEIIFIRYDDTEVCIKQRQWMYTLKNDITRMEEVQK